MKNGERYCLLIDKVSGLPLYYPNLFLTTQVRNNSLSVASMESALTGINVLLTFCDERDIALETRFLKREFFRLYELDAIRDYCQLRLGPGRVDPLSDVRPLLRKGKAKPLRTTGLASEYMRLTHIAKYSKWLAEVLLSTTLDRRTSLEIKKMQDGLKSRRPIKKGRNQVSHEKGLTNEQLTVLLKIIHPGSECNPFNDPAIQVRNQLMILLLLHLGIRGGELLNIRVKDIDWSKNQIVIARRADEKSDSRIRQPLVKKLDRRLPMKDTLVKAIHRYILEYRNKVPGSRKHDYLLVTHKSGTTQGQPLSRSGYMKVINLIGSASPQITSLHGHGLRHTWNYLFSEHMDQMVDPPTPEEQEKQRSYLQGWREGSGTAATYNKRFIEAKAKDASLALQEGISRIPENLKN